MFCEFEHTVALVCTVVAWMLERSIGALRFQSHDWQWFDCSSVTLLTTIFPCSWFSVASVVPKSANVGQHCQNTFGQFFLPSS
jgi:hypothetical protein